MGGLSNSRGNSQKSAPVKNSHGNSQESASAKNIRGNSKSAASSRHTRATIWFGNLNSSYWRRSILSTINAVGYLLLMFL